MVVNMTQKELSKIMVGYCEKCKTESTLSISQTVIRIDQQIRDTFEVHCLTCDGNDIYDTIPSTYDDLFYIPRNISINNLLSEASKEYSINYIKTDLFYMLNMFFTYNHQNVQVYINPKGVFSWSFNFRLPKTIEGDTYISIRNVGEEMIYITTNNPTINEGHIKGNLDNLFAYIIAFCDDKTNGYITNLLTIRSLGEDMENRIREIKKHFNSAYGRTSYSTNSAALATTSNFFSHISPKILTAMTQNTSVSTLLPKTNTSHYTKVGP